MHPLDVVVDVHEGGVDACDMSVTNLYRLVIKNWWKTYITSGGKSILFYLVVDPLDVDVGVHEGDVDACDMSVTNLYRLVRKN